MAEQSSIESKSDTTQKTSVTGAEQKESPKRVDHVILKRIGPDDISKYYHLIERSVMNGMPGEADTVATSTNIIAALYTGHLTGWAGLALIDDELQFVGTCVAHICPNPFTGVKTMFIVSLNATDHIATQAWRELFGQIQAYAIEHGCGRIEAVTDNERALQLARMFGFGSVKQWISKEL